MSTSSPSLTVSSIIPGLPPRAAELMTILSRNPANLADVVCEAVLADEPSFLAACTHARAAQPAWAATPAPVRAQAVGLLGRLVAENKEALSRLITREVGKPYAESLGEVQEVIDTCDFFLGEGRRLHGQTIPSEMPDKLLFTFRRPVGVVVAITAGNFPTAICSWYAVPALLTGNTVVWKPADYSPAVSAAFTELFLHAGFPEGAFSMVLADGPTTFSALERALEERLVDKIGFTGSTAVGRKISELCGRHLQTPCLELGGKNPLVVMDDADLDLAVQGALFSGFGTSGQRCTSLGTAIVHERVHDEFVSRFVAAVEQARIGDPTEDVLYGPMINEKFFSRFIVDHLGLIRDHHAVHGSTAVGQITSEAPRQGFVGNPDAGLYAHPTVVTGVSVDDEIANTETFGPLVGVARFSSWEEAIALANGHGYGLSAGIYTKEPRVAFRFREEVSAGMLGINNSTIGAEAHTPFGGNGNSGNGASRQGGQWILEQFTRWQALNWDHAGKLQKAQIDTASLAGDPAFRLSAS